MVASLMLRHLLNDDVSLSDYLSNKLVSFDDIKRRMLLKTRAAATHIPDHHYRLLQEEAFSNKNTLQDVLRLGISDLASYYLEMSGNRIHVQQQRQNDWQEMLTHIPPLIVQAALLHVQKPLSDTHPNTILNYYGRYIIPNSRYTALPYPRIPHLENFVSLNNGFHDLHMHLNGSVETDNAWQDHLSHPDRVYKELIDGFKRDKVKEQFEQESHLLEPIRYHKLLQVARRIRELFFDFIFKRRVGDPGMTEYSLLAVVVADDDRGRLPHNNNSPFHGLITGDTRNESMSIEMLMYVLVFKYIGENQSNIIGSLFHFYLLIYALCNRLLVQQTHQYGFEQFQKHTLNGLREYSETTYSKRFSQMHGNEMRNMRFLEGRFSPKKTRAENVILMQAINKGWNNLLSFSLKSKPELFLIAHFIKVADTKPDRLIRFKSLRSDIWGRATELAIFMKNNSIESNRIAGVDAAASEFDTPPEVFGPVFRYLRRQGISHFTYHAGEDFHHILCGLRAMFEAITFADLRSGDRVGHCTASGLSADRWLKIMGNAMLIRRGEWLDTLVFVRHFIIAQNIKELRGLIPILTDEIYTYFHEIYSVYFDVEVITSAWLARKHCPILLFSDNRKDARLTPVYDDDEWDEIANSNINHDTKSILRLYHSLACKKKYDQPITIDPSSIMDGKRIEILQKAVLRLMHSKEVIIETLPTSNVRIGHHQNFDTYHLWNWFKWEEEGALIPPVVVGTDDTGIFATNIYNEFANIYCNLIKKTTRNKVMDIIERLNKNSLIYKFRN